jgi:hypothetical protein
MKKSSRKLNEQTEVNGDGDDDASIVTAILQVLLQWTSAASNTDEKHASRQAVKELTEEIRTWLREIDFDSAGALEEHDHVEYCNKLATLEESMGEFRRHLILYQQCLDEELEDLFSLQTDLYSVNSSCSVNIYARALTALSIVDALQHQIQRETRLLRFMHSSLDKSYSINNEREGIIESLDRFSHALSRRDIAEQLEYQSAVHTAVDQRDYHRTSEFHLQAKASDLLSETLLHLDSSKLANIESHSDSYLSRKTRFGLKIADAKSIHEVADSFLAADVEAAVFATSLVAGDAGSGKTFLCDSLEQTFRHANANGKL